MSETCWVAIDIGCIECGGPSKVLGVFHTQPEAEAEVERYLAEPHDWTGEHAVRAFEGPLVWLMSDPRR